MKFTCPNCQTLLDVPDAVAQEKLQCGVCGQHVLIEPDSPAPPSSPAPAVEAKSSPPASLSLKKPLLIISSGIIVLLIAAVGAWFYNTKLPEIRFNDARHAARDAEAREKWDDAYAAYETAAIIRPNDTDIIESLHRVEQKKTDQEFRRAMSEGQQAESIRDWKTALTHYEEALQIIPDEPSARAAKFRNHYNLSIESAQVAEQNKQWANAAESYKSALFLKPADPTATEALTRIAYLAAIEKGAQAEQEKQWDAAKNAYEEALHLRRSDPAATQAVQRLIESQRQELYDAALRRATQSEQARQWETAEHLLQEALQYKPNDPIANEALRRVAEAQRQERYDAAFTQATDAERQRNWKVAEQFFQEALRHKPNDPQATESLQRIAYTAIIERAQQLEARHDWQQASQAYNEALRVKPNDPLAHQGLRRVAESDAAARYDAAMQAGAQSEGRKDWDNAVNAYNAALQVRPNDVQASEGLRRIDYLRHLERAQLFEQRHDWNNALGFYREALRFRPNDPLCLEGMHRIQEIVAAEQFNALLNQAANAEQRRDWNSAAQFYNDALRIRPGHPAATQSLRRLDEVVARESFNAAVQRAAESEKRKNWNDALNQYREAQRVRPNDFAVTNSIRRIEEQIRLEPFNESLKRASQAESNRRWREAADHYQRALSVKPGDSTATQGFQRAMYSDAMERGQQSEQRKDWNTAIRAFNDALGHRPGDPVANEGLRRARENLNKPNSGNVPPTNAPSPVATLNPSPVPNPSPPPNRPRGQNPPTHPSMPAPSHPPQTPPAEASTDPTPSSPAPPTRRGLKQPRNPPEVVAAYQAAMKDATAAEKKTNWTDAIAHYERALAAIPDDPVAIGNMRQARFRDAMSRGTRAYRLNNFDEAAAAFREAHNILPKDRSPIEALRSLGLSP